MALPTTVRLMTGDTMPTVGAGVYKVSNGVAAGVVAAALAAGYRHIDTAQVYGNEAAVGQAVAAFRAAHPGERVFVTSKVWLSNWGYPAASAAVRASAATLGGVDLMLLHAPGDAGARAETWRALEDAQAAGVVRNIGVSNFGTAHLEKLARTARVTPAVNQLEVHPALQRRELVAYCRDRGIVVEAYSPLAKGELLDDPVVAAVAAKHGATPARVLIRWSLQKGLVPLPKSSSPARLAANLDVWSFALDAGDLAALDGLEAGRVTGWDPVAEHEV